MKGSSLHMVGMYLKSIFLGTVYLRFALALLALGGAIFAMPNVWEYGYELVVTFLKYKYPDLEMPLPPSIDRASSYLTGGVFIASGFGVFLWFYRIDRRQKIEDAARASYFTLMADEDSNWVTWSEEYKQASDPVCNFRLSFLIETGVVGARIYTIDIDRLVKGCHCWVHNPSLVNYHTREVYEFLGDNKTLARPILIESNQSVKLSYKNRAAGPTPRFDYTELESGEYKVEVSYRMESSKEAQIYTIFLLQKDGGIRKIDRLSPPPKLNDEIIKMAFHNEILSQDEMDRLELISERSRYLAYRYGDAYYKSWPELRTFDGLLQSCQQKIEQAKLEVKH
ncbi:hypothetical protein D3879_22420 [Pseudomonas cavernicola]|uniref:Uncharacterized protein n=1 Tax=Pseudomonas cavernicola TaxID=2320866 RepID=A0A418X829_9PSED|nr:hypothetical protein [Pseudomonas cavernicola]RJG08652.1 hypothetical protein D3879_22420 [Pseudomonas cavernicola]